MGKALRSAIRPTGHRTNREQTERNRLDRCHRNQQKTGCGVCALCSRFLCAVPSASACAASQPFALRIRKKYPPGTESTDKGAQGRSAQAYRFGGSGTPESRKQRAFSDLPLRTIPKFSVFCTACAASPQRCFCAAPVSAPRGAGRAVPQACSVLRIAADKTKGQTFPPARGVFDGGSQSPSGRARSCRSFSCASACRFCWFYDSIRVQVYQLAESTNLYKYIW